MKVLETARHGVAIAGRVTDAGGDTPVAGALVTIRTDAAGFADWLALKRLGGGRDGTAARPDGALTDAAGRYRFPALPAGSYTVTAAWAGGGSRYGTASATAVVAPAADGGRFAATDLALPPTRVAGTVTARNKDAERDDPVAMAEVVLGGGGESTFSDALGRYALAGVETGKRRVVKCSVPGFATAEQIIDVSDPGRDVALDFRF